MVLAVWLVLSRGGHASTLPTSGKWLLAAALVASLAGDVFLMLPIDAFIPGLASFLLAHLFYIALFHRGVAWFASRTALFVTLAFGVAMLVVLWPNLADPVLRGAVTVDPGAASMVHDSGKSLLPSGMTSVQGDFSRGDVIAIKDMDGHEIARGLANYSSAEARLICRKVSSEFEKLLGYTGESAMVHRTNLILSR